MKWENNRRSSNIEDRRGESQSFGNSSRGSSIVSLLPLIKSLLGTKIGRVILVIGLVLYFGFGINPLSFIKPISGKKFCISKCFWVSFFQLSNCIY